jgi:hypothetical protein
MPERNRERTGAGISLFFLVVGLVSISAPFMAPIAMMNGGYALILVGGFISAGAMTAFSVFNRRANVMKSMIENRNIYVSWELSPAQQEKLYKEDTDNAVTARWASRVLGAIFIIIGIVAYLIDMDENGFFFILMSGFGLALTLMVQIYTGIQLKRLAPGNSTVVFSPGGVYFKTSLYCWDKIFNRLEAVLIDPVDNQTMLFVFQQFHVRSFSHHRCALQIGIPPGKEQEALELVCRYGLGANEGVMNFAKSMER